jgi:hypothetical protein
VGISYEDAAVAFGCNPDTMRKHYIAFDEVAVSDRVMQAIQVDDEKNVVPTTERRSISTIRRGTNPELNPPDR